MAEPGIDDADKQLADLREAVEELRQTCWNKRMILLGRGNHRQTWQRRLHVTSGIITLASSGSVAALIATASNSGTAGSKETEKMIGTIIAFLSGVLSLVVAVYFEGKETQRLFEGAAQFGVLQDRLTTLSERLGTMKRATAIDVLGKLREECRKAGGHYDQYLPTGPALVKAVNSISVLRRIVPWLGASFIRKF